MEFTDLFTQDFYDKLFKIGVKHEKMLYDFCHKPEEDDQVENCTKEYYDTASLEQEWI